MSSKAYIGLKLDKMSRKGQFFVISFEGLCYRHVEPLFSALGEASWSGSSNEIIFAVFLTLYAVYVYIRFGK